jgi:hypothetical protein
MATPKRICEAWKPQDSIDELAEHVERIWRKSRPKLMRLYDRTEQTKKRIMEAARFWRETTEDLQQAGLPFEQANNLAMYEWVCLPDIEEGDEDDILARLIA